MKFPSKQSGGGGGEADEEPLALGELAQLTVSNEPEAYDVAGASKESFRKTWNAKYTLRSHFDGVSTAVYSLTLTTTIKKEYRKSYLFHGDLNQGLLDLKA